MLNSDTMSTDEILDYFDKFITDGNKIRCLSCYSLYFMKARVTLSLRSYIRVPNYYLPTEDNNDKYDRIEQLYMDIRKLKYMWEFFLSL